ncbi:MAG TPA: YIP1 family protein, partial [Planctomycetota bacterium]|nr:YIP1 family protein [Planctomycetota bacterium]
APWNVPESLLADSIVCPSCGVATSPAKAGPIASGGGAPERFYCEWEDPKLGMFAGYWTSWWRALFHPDDFFARLPRATGLRPPTTFVLMTVAQLFAPAAFVGIVVGSALWSLASDPGVTSLGLLIIGSVAAIGLLLAPLSIAGLCVLTLVCHAGAKIAGGSGRISDTYRVLAYSWGAFALKLIPTVGPLLSLAAYLTQCLHGFKHLHRIGMIRALIVLALPALLFFALLTAAMVCAILFLMDNPEVLGH